MSVIRLLPLAALAAVALAPAPALAREARSGAARELSDPRTQQAMGDMLGTLFGLMLDLPAEPLARAMDAAGEPEAARRIPRGARIGDIAGPDARKLPAEIRRRAPAMIGALGELAGVLEEMAPEFERAAEDFGRRIDEGGAD